MRNKFPLSLVPDYKRVGAWPYWIESIRKKRTWLLAPSRKHTTADPNSAIRLKTGLVFD